MSEIKNPVGKETPVIKFESPKGYEKAPWGITVIWGKKRSGKTIAALNSPYRPVHILDTEYSSESYEKNQERMIKEKILAGPFTRFQAVRYTEATAEIERIIKSPKQYGTVVIDTYGQFTEWAKTVVFARYSEAMQTNMSQVIWGKVRDEIRSQLIQLKDKCDLIILTAHEREYNHVFSPRANPTVLELADLSIRLTRPNNEQMPNAIIDGARIPWLPPQIPKFYIRKLLDYFDKPADWDNLSEEEKIIDGVPTGVPDEGIDDG